MERKKIFVAMSGGVDSSVAAALLQKQGYDITGVFVKSWYPKGIVCGWKEERRDAIRAAAKLDIPLLTFDFSKEYEKNVVEYMKREYRAGRTPNPDVMCNKYIKFGLFLEKALKMGADFIATGHYIRHLETEFPSGNSVSKLFQAEDKNKDQSYFLWTLTQEQLKYCLFPIGDYLKPKVRQMARKFGLCVAEKKDSQGLCFVGDFDFATFLRKILPKKKGEIKTANGRIVGEHDGAHFYTIGQRHGLGISGGPYFIVAKDSEKNILIVAREKEEKDFYKREVIIDNVNFISGLSKSAYAEISKRYSARIRYRQPLQSCRIENCKLPVRLDFVHAKSGGKIGNSKNYKVIFDKPQRAVTPGQSLVLYRGSPLDNARGKEMLGGGIIV